MSLHQYPLGRLMFRVEGDFWNVYFGATPKDSLLVGSIRMSLASDVSTKNVFMAIFSDALARDIKDITGQVPTMKTQASPEHEKSGTT